MIKIAGYDLATTWTDLTLSQAKRFIAWSNTDDKSPVELLSILMNTTKAIAGSISAPVGEAMIATIIDNLQMEINTKPDVAPDKLLGRKVEFNPAKFTVAQAWMMDGVINNLKTKGIIELADDIISICIAKTPVNDDEVEQIKTDIQNENFYEVIATANFFLKSYNSGLRNQIKQSTRRDIPKSRLKQGLRNLRSSVTSTPFISLQVGILLSIPLFSIYQLINHCFT
jgi:hypothetical protein